jgi:hypothetical protein
MNVICRPVSAGFFILEFWDAAIKGGDVGAAESLMRPAFPARIL